MALAEEAPISDTPPEIPVQEPQSDQESSPTTADSPQIQEWADLPYVYPLMRMRLTPEMLRGQ